MNWGGWSVSFFIVLSGFLAFCTADGKTIDCSATGCIKYEWKRVSRMYPLHLIMLLSALALQMALIVVGRDIFDVQKILAALIPNLLLLHTWFPQNYIYFGYNGVAWFLSTYAFLCVMFPLLNRMMQRWNIKRVICSVLICWCIPFLLSLLLEITKHNEYREWLLYVFPPVRLLEFFAGMQIGWIFCNKRVHLTSKADSTIEMLLCIISILARWFLNAKIGGSILIGALSEYIVVFMPIALIGVYVIADGKGIINDFLSNRVLVQIGNVSMYAFLIHYLVIQYVHMFIVNFVVEEASTFAVTIASMLLTAVLTLVYLRVKIKVRI